MAASSRQMQLSSRCEAISSTATSTSGLSGCHCLLQIRHIEAGKLTSKLLSTILVGILIVVLGERAIDERRIQARWSAEAEALIQ